MIDLTTMPIEIIQDDTDKTDYLAIIVGKLNKRFTTQEEMESRWMLNCIEIARELNCGITCLPKDYVMFDFSLNGRMNDSMRPTRK